MPISKYDSYFGGKKGAAQKTLSAMIAKYGKEKGTRIFYATKNRNAGEMKRGQKLSPLHKALGK